MKEYRSADDSFDYEEQEDSMQACHSEGTEAHLVLLSASLATPKRSVTPTLLKSVTALSSELLSVASLLNS